MPWQHATWFLHHLVWPGWRITLIILTWTADWQLGKQNNTDEVCSVSSAESDWPGCCSPLFLSRHTLTGVRRIQEPLSKICNRWSESTAISPENSAQTRKDSRSYMMWLLQTHTPSSRSYFSTVFPVCHVSQTVNCIKPPLCSCNEVGSVRVYTEASHQDFLSGS